MNIGSNLGHPEHLQSAFKKSHSPHLPSSRSSFDLVAFITKIAALFTPFSCLRMFPRFFLKFLLCILGPQRDTSQAALLFTTFIPPTHARKFLLGRTVRLDLSLALVMSEVLTGQLYFLCLGRLGPPSSGLHSRKAPLPFFLGEKRSSLTLWCLCWFPSPF